MSDTGFPYSAVVGQEWVKLALELAWIQPRLGGVLLSGERGTAKSTVVRAFTRMMTGKNPVTLPINATEDRVVGGLSLADLLAGKPTPGWQLGLLEQARDGMLYIDEINLLDDHIVNLLLDVTSTGVLTVQRDNQERIVSDLRFTLVGSMNPGEGLLRPQLLDRFALVVVVTTAGTERVAILKAVLGGAGDRDARTNDGVVRARLEAAREACPRVLIGEDACRLAVAFAERFKCEGHRAERDLVLAAQAHAARRAAGEVDGSDLKKVARMALLHRRPGASARDFSAWGDAEEGLVAVALGE